MSNETIIFATLAVPAFGAVMIWLTGSAPNLRESITLITGVVLFALIASLAPAVMAGERPAAELITMMPGLAIAFRVEPLGLLFGLVASFLWIVTSIYSIGYMRAHHEVNQTRFYVFFAIAILSTIGVAFAANMLTLFIFYEVLSLSTFPLVTHSGTPEAKRAGRLYMGILIGASIGFLLLAIIWTWTITGTLDFTRGGILEGKASNTAAAILLALYVFGIGKTAMMPFHRWLPAAMVAPTPVSALLHAVAVVKVGVFTVLKVTLYIFGPGYLSRIGASEWLQYVAAATILIASLVAMTKDNLKARLAYSTISQLSYIVLGAMLANNLGIIGGGMHIAAHAFGKITLFFCAGAIMVASGKTKVSQMDGLGRVMPFTMAAFFIAALSVIGLPPLGGMWSKWYLALGALKAGNLFLVGVLMFSSLLNIAYLMPIPIRGFFGKRQADGDPENKTATKIREAPLPCLIAIGITALGGILLFFWPGPVYDLMRLAVQP